MGALLHLVTSVVHDLVSILVTVALCAEEACHHADDVELQFVVSIDAFTYPKRDSKGYSPVVSIIFCVLKRLQFYLNIRIAHGLEGR